MKTLDETLKWFKENCPYPQLITKEEYFKDLKGYWYFEHGNSESNRIKAAEFWYYFRLTGPISGPNNIGLSEHGNSYVTHTLK